MCMELLVSMEMQNLDIHKDGLHNFDHYFIININYKFYIFAYSQG